MRTLVATIAILVIIITNAHEIMPRNSLSDCKKQFNGANRIEADCNFCECIHKQGKPLDQCLNEYKKAADDIIQQLNN